MRAKRNFSVPAQHRWLRSSAASFRLGGLGIDTATRDHIVTVAVIAVIGTVGYTKGLEMLQNLEKIAL